MTLTGNTQSGTWTSEVDVQYVILKGARSEDVITPGNPNSGDFSNINLFTPSGQQAGISHVRFCGEETVVTPDCVECGEGANDANRIAEVTLRYLGPPGIVTVYDNNRVHPNWQLFNQLLSTGDIFTVSSSAIGRAALRAKIGIYIDGEAAAEIHTSCSAPLAPGMTEATQPTAKNPNGTEDVEVVGGADSQGRPLCGGDECPIEPSSPEISFSIVEEGGLTYVEVMIVDEFGIEEVDIVEHGPPFNLEENLEARDFEPGQLMARFLFRILDLSMDTSLSVQAANSCDQVGCPDVQPPSIHTITVALDDDTGTVGSWPLPSNWQEVYPQVSSWSRFGREATVSDDVGVIFYQTFAENNVFVFEQPVAGCLASEGCELDPALESFRVVMGTANTSMGGSYGLLVADACNAFVLDPEIPAGTAARPVAGGSLSGTTNQRASLPGIPDASARAVQDSPVVFALEQNFPNPAVGTTSIRFSLPEAGPATLVLHDVLGRTVRVLADGEFQQGDYVMELDISALASGMYVYRLTAGANTAIRRLTIVR